MGGTFLGLDGDSRLHSGKYSTDRLAFLPVMAAEFLLSKGRRETAHVVLLLSVVEVLRET